jgi:hypothetical protein
MAAQTNPKLRTDLLKKLGSSPQALSQRRNRVQKKVAMPTDIATYLIAHQQGLRLDRYLDLETIQVVNDFIAKLDAKDGAPGVESASITKSPSQKRTIRSRQIAFDQFKVAPEALSDAHIKDAETMAGRVYPVLYVFENSAREFLDGHLTEAFGSDWFQDSKIVSRGIRDIVERNRSAEKKNRYHSKRKARSIYYTDLSHLATISESEKGEKLFVKGKLFPRKTWFPEMVGHFEVSRNVVAHMNPLPMKDVRRLEDRLKEWLDQIAGHLPPKSDS